MHFFRLFDNFLAYYPCCAGVGDSFLEQQMAKLMARKGQEGEGGSSSSLLMKRSKSGDIPRPDSLSLVRSVSGELRSEQKKIVIEIGIWSASGS